jgi:16S rRNA (cytosine1402-N4)-methyltransferase
MDRFMAENTSHQPVMVREAMEFLSPGSGGIFVDCTVGAGGHSETILEASLHSRVIGVDRDESALEIATVRLDRFGSRFTAIASDFKRLRQVLENLDIRQVDGILVDLGVSSIQLEQAERGFSFRHEGPLDMRMDRRQSLTAADLVDTLSEAELADIIYEYGEEHAARRIARAIVRRRQQARIETTGELADTVLHAIRGSGRWRIHPATRTFQALRIAVNDELKGLDTFVGEAIAALGPGGRLVVISFHSLEDRLIKWAFKLHAGHCQCRMGIALPGVPCPGCGAWRRVEILTRKPVQPGAAETAMNPRARSAKLRACRKLADAPDRSGGEA